MYKAAQRSAHRWRPATGSRVGRRRRRAAIRCSVGFVSETPSSFPGLGTGREATAGLPPVPESQGKGSATQAQGPNEKPVGVNAPLDVPIDRLGGVEPNPR